LGARDGKKKKKKEEEEEEEERSRVKTTLFPASG
jgi:hypothetical protein